MESRLNAIASEQIQIVVEEVSKRLSRLNKPFTDRDVYRLVAEESQGRGIGLELACSIAKGYLHSDDLVMVKEFQKSKLYESRRETLIQVPKRRDLDLALEKPIIEMPRAKEEQGHILILER